MRLIVGTYDGGVCGWESAPSTTGGAPTFEESFAYNPHMGAVKAVAASGVREGGRDLLASGSIDETVRVYDLARGKELGSLVEHTDTVTAVDWYRHSHMLSAGLDGAICVWRASDWTCMLTLRHPGGVTSLAVHPSGRLAFTVGVDTTYRVWDIVKGNVALQRKLGFKVKKVQWSPNGERFVLVADDHVQVRSIVDDAFVCDLPHSTAVSDAVFVGNDAVATSESTSLVVRLWKLVDGAWRPATARWKNCCRSSSSASRSHVSRSHHRFSPPLHPFPPGRSRHTARSACCARLTPRARACVRRGGWAAMALQRCQRRFCWSVECGQAPERQRPGRRRRGGCCSALRAQSKGRRFVLPRNVRCRIDDC